MRAKPTSNEVLFIQFKLEKSNRNRKYNNWLYNLCVFLRTFVRVHLMGFKILLQMNKSITKGVKEITFGFSMEKETETRHVVRLCFSVSF